MLELRYYLGADGRSPFARWFEDLNPIAGAKVVRALARMEQGNLSNVKSVGEGVLEYKIDFGPGYRICFGKEGDQLVILLGGGSKTRQQVDIAEALTSWQEYKQRKKENPHAPHT